MQLFGLAPGQWLERCAPLRPEASTQSLLFIFSDRPFRLFCTVLFLTEFRPCLLMSILPLLRVTTEVRWGARVCRGANIVAS